MRFRIVPYERAHREPCLALFDLNTPAFFAANERSDYEAFLDKVAAQGAGTHTLRYFLGESLAGDAWIPVAAVGFAVDDATMRGRVQWILSDPRSHGQGVGRALMSHALELAREHHGLRAIDIAASHLSAPFFEKFGARAVSHVTDGWGPGMHRVDMVLEL